MKPYESKKSQFTRNLIRRRHAEWSERTFGNVGPVGPLKHLSKEALEASADPGDLSEWADMQFLLWDAQRRAGITDEQITAALEEKLKVNMARQWPEPKDGEPLSLCFGQRLEILVKSGHAGDAGATVADVVDYFVGGAEDFAGRAVVIGVPGIRLDYPEHWVPP